MTLPQGNVVHMPTLATGKTTVGKLLADQLGYEFVDTDELIIERSGQSVAEIFRDKGEAVFPGGAPLLLTRC